MEAGCGFGRYSSPSVTIWPTGGGYRCPVALQCEQRPDYQRPHVSSAPNGARNEAGSGTDQAGHRLSVMDWLRKFIWQPRFDERLRRVEEEVAEVKRTVAALDAYERWAERGKGR